jgi:CheY-like chemotaxis protein
VNPPPPFVIVDDNHDDLFILKRLLTRAGAKNPFITFDHSGDAMRFLAAALRTPESQLVPAAIFSDKAMPDRSGFELLKWVRRQPLLTQTPFVMFTSVAEAADRKRARELGVTGFYEKYPAQHIVEEIVAEIAKASMARGK